MTYVIYLINVYAQGIGLYLDPNAKNFVRGGEIITEQTIAMLWVQAIALVLSIVIGMMTFTGRYVVVVLEQL